jgi:hypothetical protein
MVSRDGKNEVYSSSNACGSLKAELITDSKNLAQNKKTKA